MHITMIGTGYVGLVSGVCFAELGIRTTCVDKNEDKINLLNNGGVPIFEPGLEEMVKRLSASGIIDFTTDIASAVKKADAVFIGVGTPTSADGMSTDLSYVEMAARDIAKSLDGYTVVVVKSTVPVGTCRRVAEIIRETNPEADFDVCDNPEFLREGAAIGDFLKPDRVVVGCDSERGRGVMKEIYATLEKKGHTVQFTGVESAELIKYASNAFLATKITFINQMADLCEKVGADVADVAMGMGLDTRIGPKFLRAGPGYGGSCFPKDTKSLAVTGKENGVPITIVDAVIAANEKRKHDMATRVINAVKGQISGKTIGVLGCAFKPDTDDMRDSPALDILPILSGKGAKLKVYDPQAMKEAKELLEECQITWCDKANDAMKDADLVLLLTEWQEFMALSPADIKQSMAGNILVDLRNVFEPCEAAKAGLHYLSIGKKPHVLPKECDTNDCKESA